MDLSSKQLNRKISKRLKEIRIATGFYPSEVTKSIEGLRSARLSEWENGKTIIPLVWIVKLADFYGVSVDYLIGNTDECDALRPTMHIKKVMLQQVEELANAIQPMLTNQAEAIQIYSNTIDIAESAIHAYHKMVDCNPDLWQEMRAGAKLETTMAHLENAVQASRAAHKKHNGLSRVKRRKTKQGWQYWQDSLPFDN